MTKQIERSRELGWNRKICPLIQRALGGSGYWDTLVRKVQDRVYYHCKKMLNKEEDTCRTPSKDVLITMITSLDKLQTCRLLGLGEQHHRQNPLPPPAVRPPRGWQIPGDEKATPCWMPWRDLDETLVPERRWTTRRPAA